MKLFIIGVAGSGKTTLAKRVGNLARLEMTNLDELFWLNDGKSYGVRRPEADRESLFQAVLGRPSWIIEGAYVGWPRRAMEEADMILYLDIDIREVRKRIIGRFIKRILGKDRENKIENLRSLRDLLAWNRSQIVKIQACVAELRAQGKVITVVRNEAEIESFLRAIAGREAHPDKDRGEKRHN